MESNAGPVLPYEPSQPPKGALLTIFLVALIDMLGFGLLIPLLPFYATRFGASPTQVGLLFAIFSICQFIATPILGAWSDQVGRKRILVFSQIGNGISYVLLAWASQHHWEVLTLGLLTVYISRVIAGLTSGNISAAQAYISDITTPENRTKGMGALGAAFGFGFALGPAMGGMLSHYLHPAAPAWAAAFLSLASAVLCMLRLQEARRHVSTSASNYLHPRSFRPLLANRDLMKINAMWFVAMTAFVAGDAMIVLFLSRVMSYGESHVAWYLLMVGIVILVTQGRLVGMLRPRFGEWGLCIIGLLICGAGALLHASLAVHAALWLVIVSGIISAFGRSLFQPTISALVSHHSPAELQGGSFGFFQGVGTFARIVGPLIAGPLFSRHVSWPWIMASAMLWISGLWLGRLRLLERRAERLPVANKVA